MTLSWVSILNSWKQHMTRARDPKQWFWSPSGMLECQLAWEASWIRKCWFSLGTIDVWARDHPFRLDETRASVTKYCFEWVTCGKHSWISYYTPPGPLQCKHCLGNKVTSSMVMSRHKIDWWQHAPAWDKQSFHARTCRFSKDNLVALNYGFL